MDRGPVEIVEVGPRDGLQNEGEILSTANKLELINRCLAAGVKRIEVASFVHPTRVPQMADAEAVCAGLPAADDVTYVGLVMNMRGAERAIAAGVHEIGAVACSSDGFGVANQGRSSAETVEDAIAVIQRAKAAGRRAQATITVAFGCPFDGPVAADRVVEAARRIAAADPHEIAIADTIGVATPAQVRAVMRAVRAAVPGMPLRLHFHDTRNMGVANAWAALEERAATLDASVGGAGGCPFAPGATGNVATEDLLYMLAPTGRAPRIDLDGMIETGVWLGKALGKELPSKQAKAPAHVLEGLDRRTF
jgi:hydroxymethylglutaryl-CoA lyase